MPTATPTPNAQEQLLLELTNRARMSPVAEFDALIANAATKTGGQDNISEALDWFGVDLTALRSQFDTLTPVAPLAWNNTLGIVAETHTQLLLDANAQSHQLEGEAELKDRVRDAGYNWTSLGENVFSFAKDMVYGHAGFFIDWGHDEVDLGPIDPVTRIRPIDPNFRNLGDGIQDPPGHRNTIMNLSERNGVLEVRNYTEIGIAVIEGTGVLQPGQPAGTPIVGPYLITQNFGSRAGYQAQLLGVVIDDRDADSFYDIGEGLGGITVTATGAAGTFTTTSWASGGYQMVLPAGSYRIAFSGDPLGGTASYNATIGTANVKLDAFSRDALANLRLLGRAEQQDTLSGGRGDDMLYGNGYRAVYDLDEARAVYRLYQATLDRAPDAAGQAGWTEQLASGANTLTGVAAGFVGSQEFQNVYGALDNTDFVELLYQNVLGRAADAGGLQGWTNALAGGTSRAQVVTGFSESTEFRNATNQAATEFTQGRDAAFWQDDVYRLYQATLARAPDVGGFQGWLTNLSTGTPFLMAVAGFVNSAEFQNTYGALSNTAFVELLYQNVLGRGSDPGGLQGWLAALDGGQSRAQVVQGFSQSAEFIFATAPGVKAWIRAQGQDDVLEGGAGSNDLWGGAGADVFRFDQADAGSHRVHDFEAWDYLEFRAFGYADAAAIRANMTQQGADVVFSDQGTTVTLANTQLESIDNDTFVF